MHPHTNPLEAILKRTQWLVWLMALMALTFASGCSDDDSNPTGTPSGNAPVFGGTSNNITVPAGMANSQDPNAQLAYAYVNMANGISAHGGWFNPPTRAIAVAGPPWESTWTNGPLTVTLIVNETDTMYTWDVYLDGTSDEVVFDNFHFYSAWSYIDGSCGGLSFFGYDSSAQIDWDWCTESNGDFTMTMTFTDGSDVVVIDLLVHPDGSGEVSYTVNGVMVSLVVWDAMGNGQWNTWDSGGTPTGSGTWTAAVN